MAAISALKVENRSLFSSTESISLSNKKKTKKKKRKRGDGKKKKIKKKNLHSPDFYIIFDCIRNFERLKMVACPKTYFFAILRRFANAMPENPLHASGQ